MVGKSHFRVRGVTCGKCERIHTWYKYRVWREGSRVKEEYIGKCDQYGNEAFAHADDEWQRVWEAWARQWEQAYRSQQAYSRPQQKPNRTPYEILGVSYTATTAQIKQAYYRLVKQYHPDQHPGIDQTLIAEINAAYDILVK